MGVAGRSSRLLCCLQQHTPSFCAYRQKGCRCAGAVTVTRQWTMSSPYCFWRADNALCLRLGTRKNQLRGGVLRYPSPAMLAVARHANFCQAFVPLRCRQQHIMPNSWAVAQILFASATGCPAVGWLLTRVRADTAEAHPQEALGMSRVSRSPHCVHVRLHASRYRCTICTAHTTFVVATPRWALFRGPWRFQHGLVQDMQKSALGKNMQCRTLAQQRRHTLPRRVRLGRGRCTGGSVACRRRGVD